MTGDTVNKVEKPKPSVLKQAALQILAGGSAGFVEVCIMHPLDLVKTRLQIQNKKAVKLVAGKTQQVNKNLLYRFMMIFKSWARSNAKYVIIDCFGIKKFLSREAIKFNTSQS